MKKLLALALILPALAAPPSLDQVKDFPADLRPQLDRLRDAAMKSDWAFEKLERLCDDIGPRLSGTPQAEQAVQYVAGEMRQLGLKVTLQPCQVPRWVRGEASAELLGTSPQKLSLLALGGSAPTPPGGLTGQVFVVSELEQLDNPAVQGKIVLIDHPFDDRMAEVGEGGRAYGDASRFRVRGPERAARNGAIACLVRSIGGAEYRLPHTGVTIFSQGPPIPAAAVSEEDAMLLARRAARGPIQVRLTLTCRDLPPVPSHNVIADLPGSTSPEEVVIVSGHLDSWDVGTGALDDGSGVVMAMQAVHLMKELGLKPRRTVRMIAFMNEENGSAGSDAYFEAEQGNLPNHFAAIESDFGCGHPFGFIYTSKPETQAILAPIARALEPIGAGTMRQMPGAGADIHPLVKAGVPGFHPLQDSRTYFDYHHTEADTLDKVNPLSLRENCAVVSVLAYALANL